ncbi:MAG: discoidin domain-containing protein [Blastocatellia bacterium]
MASMAGMGFSSTLRTLLNKVSQSRFLQGCLCLAALCFCLTVLSARLAEPGAQTLASQTPASQTQASQTQTRSIRIPINVSSASLPITIGVPVSEAAKLYDPMWLGVTDANGAPVPAQMRVLARWRGGATDAIKPVKWLLVDFKPNGVGLHFVTPAARADLPPVTIADAGGAVHVSNSRIDIELFKSGEALVKSFKLGGREQLRAPVTAQAELPRRALITRLGPAPDTVIVNDTSLLKAGDVARFEHADTLKWDAPAGSSRLVVNDWSFTADRRYRIDEGTPRQEEVEISSTQPGDLRTAALLKFDHAAGATIRDLSVEREAAVIKSVSGQTVQFTAPLKPGHLVGEKLIVKAPAEAANQTANAVIERTTVEESNPLRAVVRQDGYFKSAAGKTPPTVVFTLRYYVYANQPFVRVRLRMMNNGAFGFGAYRSFQPPFPQHALLRSLSVSMPTVMPGSGVSQVLDSAEAHARLAEKQSGASLTAGLFEIAVPEFVENFPKALKGGADGIRFEILPNLGPAIGPDTGADYIFDGARAKTTDFYIGQQTISARGLTTSVNATLDPAYIATTGAVRPAFIERRDWRGFFGKEEQMGEAANRVERMFASGYAVEATDEAGAVPPTSIFEYRDRSENGEQFGWRNFGDLAWGDGYANVHYDLPFVLLREYLRSGDARAFRLGGEMARYRADWGHYRADDFLTVEKTWNFKGLAFYEKGDHGTFKEPVPSHSWIEGMWLYWALTGDEAVRESAVDGAEAFLRMNFTYATALGWNEPRWVGWPVHGLVAAYRYTGDARYLNKAREDVNLLVQTEEMFGRKGHYISRGADVIQATQPWAWCYSQLGVIEYWRETGDRRIGDYLVRIADWLTGKQNPPIKPGSTMADGTYMPNGISYFWTPDKVAEDRSVALAGLALPVLATAARISNRPDLRARAQQIFRDYAFYRDFVEGKSVAAASRHVINFRSLLFPASATKVYGQMGLTVSEYLPEIAGSVVVPGEPVSAQPMTSQPIAPRATPPAGKPTPSPAPLPPRTLPAPAALANVALNRPATASSVRQWSDVIGTPNAANDGQTGGSGKASAWHSDSNTGKPDWWQVDLGKKFQLTSVEIVFRNDQDQPVTRRNFEILASNDPSFKTSTKLTGRGETPVPFKQTWRANVTEAEGFRYVRVQKTKIDTDAYGQSFFTFEEARVFGRPFRSETTPAPQRGPFVKPVSLSKIRSHRLLVGQSLSFTLSQTDERGAPVLLYAYNLPGGAAFDASTGNFLFTPNSTQAGNAYQITFRAINEQTDKLARMDVAVVIDGAPDITLLNPAPGTSLAPNKPALISWSTSQPTSQPARMKKYQIRFSLDGGASYPMVIAELPGHVNRYQWVIPKDLPVTKRARVRLMIKGVNESGGASVDFSKQDLRINE